MRKSSAGAQQALAPATLNSVTSVPSLRHGSPASESLPSTFSNVLPTTPLNELYPRSEPPRRIPQRIPISRIILSTVLSAITAPRSARRHMAACLWPRPLAVREKISVTAPRSFGLVARGGCASA